MAILIDKYGNKEEIPYYSIEQKFIDIIETANEDIKKQFEEFKQKYKYFTPYFDFGIFHLGYTIENPMGYDERLLVAHNDRIYILKNMNYEKYKTEPVKYSDYEYFTVCDDETLKIKTVQYDPKYFDNGIIDHENNFISLAGMRIHQNLAILIVNQMIIRNKNIFECFLNYPEDYFKEISFLEDEIGFIRFGIEGVVLLTYRKSKISDKQKSYIDYLEKNDLLLEGYIPDKDEAEKIERASFRPNK